MSAYINFNHEGQGRGCGEREARDEVALVHLNGHSAPAVQAVEQRHVDAAARGEACTGAIDLSTDKRSTSASFFFLSQGQAAAQEFQGLEGGAGAGIGSV